MPTDGASAPDDAVDIGEAEADANRAACPWVRHDDPLPPLRPEPPPPKHSAEPSPVEQAAEHPTDEPARDDENCLVCMAAAATHAFVPCGHQCVCSTCADRVTGSEGDGRCPYCRVPSMMTMPIFKPC